MNHLDCLIQCHYLVQTQFQGSPRIIPGDEASKLTVNSYPKEQPRSDMKKAIYNYLHTRTQRNSENAFGILSHYFRIFFTPHAIKPESINLLHNLLQNERIPYPNEDT
jgi:hypothetical protein